MAGYTTPPTDHLQQLGGLCLLEPCRLYGLMPYFKCQVINNYISRKAEGKMHQVEDHLSEFQEVEQERDYYLNKCETLEIRVKELEAELSRFKDLYLRNN